MKEKALTISSKSNDHKPPFVIGIDLGTTNSLMAMAGLRDATRYLPAADAPLDAESSLPQFIPVKLLQLPQPNEDGTVASHILFPSVVFQADGDSRPLVGMGAKEAKFHFRRGRNVFYSVKLDLGTDREPFYPGAVSNALDSPVKVSALILRSMREAAEKQLGCSLREVPTVITIPASFQSPQRKDTLQAAKLAGFSVDASCLFDEPNAALLAYMNRRRIQQRWNHEETVLVFDFGGGTCDISIIDVSFAPVRNTINLRSLAISRFEQLGGDDIDKHLVHTFLKQHFYEVSGSQEREWSFAERQFSIWSQLGKIAELLKIRFCEELDRAAQFSDWDPQRLKDVKVSIPAHTVSTTQGQIQVDHLSLDWNRFTQIMEPFLDVDGAQNEDREYYRITSIFTPIQDALDKANLERRGVTRILLAGGSSRNPLVEQAIQEFFPEATLERPNDMEYLIAEGAAVHAYTRFVLGHDILSPIIGDTIGLLAEKNQFIPLVQAGSPIPFPDQTDWITYTRFRVPREFMSHVDLVICAGSANRPVHTVKLKFERVIPMDTAVHLRIRLDENKIFHLEAFLPDYPDTRVSETIDNPLGLLPMTSQQRERAELEKTLMAAQASRTLEQHVPQMERLAEVLNDMDRSEQALGWVEQAIKRNGQATPRMMQLKAEAHHSLGEDDQAHKIWTQLSDQNEGDTYAAMFASLTAQDLRTKEKYIRRAIQAAPGEGIFQYQLAMICKEMGEFSASRQALEKARQLLEARVQHYPHERWTLSYLAVTYEELGQIEKASAVWQKYQALQDKPESPVIDSSNLVGLTYEITKRQSS
jgi:molecular chaperone DnaK